MPEIVTSSPHALLLWIGGPLAALERRLGLRHPDRSSGLRRSLCYICVGWVSFLLLALCSRLLRGSWEPLLFDLAVHVRWLLSVPLIVIAEQQTAIRIAASSDYLVRAKVVVSPASYVPALTLVGRLRDSVLCEGGLLLLAVGVGLPPLLGHVVSSAALWYELVSLSLFRFLFFRWMWRWGLWGLFIWRVSRLPLRLLGSHPDRLGGLGVLSLPSRAFGLFVLAASCTIASRWGMQVLHQGVTLPELILWLVPYLGVVFIFALAPLFSLLGPLVYTRLTSYYSFMRLAQEHDARFWQKWIESTSADPLGSPDMSSLADLGSAAFDRVAYQLVLPFPRLLLLELTLLAREENPIFSAGIPDLSSCWAKLGSRASSRCWIDQEPTRTKVVQALLNSARSRSAQHK